MVVVMLLLSGPAYAQAIVKLTLEQSLDIALTQSFDVKRLEQSLMGSRMNLKAAEAGFKSNGELQLTSLPNFEQNERRTPLPGGTFAFDRQQFMDVQTDVFANQPIGATNGLFSLIGSLQRFQQFDVRTGPGGSSNPSQYGTQVRLQFRQPLFTYNRLKTGLRKAELNLESTLQTYTRNQLDLVFNVTSRFYDFYRAQQQLLLDQQEVARAEESYRVARLKQEAGLLAEVDVLRLEVDLANARNTAANSEASLRQNEDAFKVLIGVPLETSVEVTTGLTYRPVTVSVEAAIGHALQRRTELRTDDITIQLGEINVTEIDAQREITGELFLSYGLFNRRDRFQDIVSDFNNDRRVQLSVSVPLWDWSQNTYSVQAARANLENDRLTRQHRVNTIKQEIRAAVRNFSSAQQRVEITRRSQELAEKSYRISFLKFQNGELNTQDLTLEQNRLAQARRNSLDAIIDYQQALADLRRKTLWDFERNQPVRLEVKETG
ncbi:MAG: TolC family protein [Candidatus Latescibacteria bacterium]|nr:TolC family protein [Candidatus Latescibacterota bacterium]